MSESNGQGRQLGRVMFVRAVDMMRTHREQFMRCRPTAAVAAVMLSELCGFDVSKGQVSDVCKASGVTWEPKKGPNKSSVPTARKLRQSCRYLRRLYRKLGEEVPIGLDSLCEGGEDVTEDAPATPQT